MHILHKQRCRVCGGINLAPVIDLGAQFLQGSFVKPPMQNPPTRKVPTRHGEIECPSLGYLRFRGGTVLPYGSTRLLVCNVEGKEATLVLLTANPD